ncbi:hypothetical protein ACHAXA_003325 [Cyclostephanos tholiformis]|uniref:Uncharacterized protein n=1 Tax=Cyclostephanos tholiformis TaxID=382380 RepID=A0ABD3SBP9_9STRA
MQHWAKCKLEETWEETERLMVENSSLEDQLADIRGKLRASMLSVGYIRQISAQAGEHQSVNSNYSFDGGSNFIENKLSSSLRKIQPQSNFRNSYSTSALDTLCDKNSNGNKGFNGERSCDGRFSRIWRGTRTELGRNVKSCTSVDSDSHDSIEIDEQLFDSLLSQDREITSSCYSFDNSSCTLDDGCDAVSGLYYPAPDINSLARQTLAESSIGDGSPSAPAAEALERIVLDDFDFDPLHSFSESDQNKTVNEKSKNKRDVSVTRRSFMSLFGDRNNDDFDDYVSSLHRLIKEKAAMTKTPIRRRENDIERATRLVQIQKEEVLTYEKIVAKAWDKCDENEKQSQEKQSKIKKEVDALQLLYAEMELRLNRHESSLQQARKDESSLKQRLVMIDQLCQENVRELDLEAQLSRCQRQYKACHEIATGTLSTLLADANCMCIPSLHEVDEGNVFGDITSIFGELANKEEELVKVLGTPNLLLHLGEFNLSEFSCWLGLLSKRDGGDKETMPL